MVFSWFLFREKRNQQVHYFEQCMKNKYKNFIENKVIIFTSTCRPVSCVSRVTRAIKGPHGIVTISIDITIIGVVCTLVKI